MIYKFGYLFLSAGTLISITLIINNHPFLGFLFGVLTLASIDNDTK